MVLTSQKYFVAVVVILAVKMTRRMMAPFTVAIQNEYTNAY